MNQVPGIAFLGCCLAARAKRSRTESINGDTGGGGGGGGTSSSSRRAPGEGRSAAKTKGKHIRLDDVAMSPANAKLSPQSKSPDRHQNNAPTSDNDYNTLEAHGIRGGEASAGIVHNEQDFDLGDLETETEADFMNSPKRGPVASISAVSSI